MQDIFESQVNLNKRLCGVLLPIFSLHGEQGIGTFGKSAKKFIDYVSKSGMKYWQILPLQNTTIDNSPYTSYSAMAGNPLFIDLDELQNDGYLKKEDYINIDWGQKNGEIDYKKVRAGKNKVFEKLYENFIENIPLDFQNFCEKEQYWLDDYALFMSLHDAFDSEFMSWPKEYKFRNFDALEKFRHKHKDEITYHKMLQYFFFKQWINLREYANIKSVALIGDIPFYVAHDSADLWSNPEYFWLDENLDLVEVAGCPPDLFSEKGQLWNNPVYEWENLKDHEYDWWMQRLKVAFEFYDILRIDHFRGFESFYCIPSGCEDARNGTWRKGPGYDFFATLESKLGKRQIIAEDLGFITSEVKDLLTQCGYPGMKILQFAFDSRDESDGDFLPYNYVKNSVVYANNHDNDTTCGWINTAKKADVKLAKEYYDVVDDNDLCEAFLYQILSSVSNTCILSVQDLLGLGSEARINTPSTNGKYNWKWRLSEDQFNQLVNDSKLLKRKIKVYGRNH